MISSIRLGASTACLALEGATDTEIFRAYVAEVLVPPCGRGERYFQLLARAPVAELLSRSTTARSGLSEYDDVLARQDADGFHPFQRHH